MSKVFVDAGVSIDGFWAGATGKSVFPVRDMQESGLIDPLVERTGAVVMSRRSFEMAPDPDWYAGNYEFQVPLHVVTDAPPARNPKEAGGMTFSFHHDFETAISAARLSAGDADVAIIGERSAIGGALRADAVDEIYLRVVPVVCGSGERLLDETEVTRRFSIAGVRTTIHAVHIQFVRNPD